MSDRPTPETDALEQKQASEGCPQWNDMMRWVREHAALARKLERERDEAREVLREIEDKMCVQLRGHPESKLWGDAGLIAATMRCVDALDVVTEQRDEALEKYDLEAVEHMLAINKLCNERDILRLDAQKEDEHHDRMVGELERVYAERDDALNQIQGWENKWKVAVDMAAIAENKVSNLEDQLDLAMKVIKRLEANQP